MTINRRSTHEQGANRQTPTQSRSSTAYTGQPATLRQGVPAVCETRTKAAQAMGGTATTTSANRALEMVSGSPVAVAEGWLLRESAQHGLVAERAHLAGQVKQAERKARKDRPPTVAVDLDGTLAKMYDRFDAKKIEPPRPGARKALKRFQDRGWRIIVHTVRGDDQMVKDWLHEHDIPWDYINENPDQPPDASDKPVADLYLDDRGLDARKAWNTVADEAIKRIEKQGEVLAWQEVPVLVAVRYKEAASVQRSIAKVTKHLPVADPGYGHVYWNPDTKTAWAVLSDGDDNSVHQKWTNALKAIPGVRNVRTEAEYGPHGDNDWIRVKAASGALSWLNTPYQAAGAPFGGPSPMSNSIVSGLIGAGLGYGGGWLAEQLLPEEYVERGKLRKNLALLGGLGGAALHIPQAFANAGINRNATGKSHWMRSIALGDRYQQMAPHEPDWRNHYMGGHIKQNEWELMRRCASLLPDVDNPLLLASNRGFVKEAFAMGAGAFGSQGVPLKPVPVDAFNRAIWNDVHNGPRSSMASSAWGTNPTPPAHAAAAAGLVSGVQQMHGGSPVLHPKHFISGLANAGVDLATARVAGGVLGALGGLTPYAQKKIQDMGMWSGMIRGVTGSVLGLR